MRDVSREALMFGQCGEIPDLRVARDVTIWCDGYCRFPWGQRKVTILKARSILPAGLLILVGAVSGIGGGAEPSGARAPSGTEPTATALSGHLSRDATPTRWAVDTLSDTISPLPLGAPHVQPAELDAERLASIPREDKDPKLSSHLVRLLRADKQERAAGRRITARSLAGVPDDVRSMVEARRLRLDDLGNVQVYVQASGTIKDTLRAVERAGGTVERSDAEAGIVQAQVQINRLAALSADPAARLVRLPDYGFRQAGSVTMQVDAILKANLARA